MQATSEPDVYTFQMSDGSFGWVALSLSGDHLLYLDRFRIQPNEPSLIWKV